jgi:hypothetical protein
MSLPSLRGFVESWEPPLRMIDLARTRKPGMVEVAKREGRGETGSVVVDSLVGLPGTSALYTGQPSQNTFPSMWVQKTAETPEFILTKLYYRGSTPRSFTTFSV